MRPRNQNPATSSSRSFIRFITVLPHIRLRQMLCAHASMERSHPQKQTAPAPLATAAHTPSPFPADTNISCFFAGISPLFDFPHFPPRGKIYHMPLQSFRRMNRSIRHQAHLRPASEHQKPPHAASPAACRLGKGQTPHKTSHSHGQCPPAGADAPRRTIPHPCGHPHDLRHHPHGARQDARYARPHPGGSRHYPPGDLLKCTCLPVSA